MRKALKQNLAYDDRNGLYYVTFHIGMRADGSRRRTVRTFHDREDAERALAEFRFPFGGTDTLPRKDMPLCTWLTRWLREYVRPNCEMTTRYGYEAIVRNHLVPALGSIKLCALTPALLEDYYTHLLALGLSANTVRKHHTLLRTALEAAVRSALVPENAARRALPPSRCPSRRAFYDPRQLAELFRLCRGEPIEPALKLAGYLGLRRSEICALKWQHIDLASHIIDICEARTAAGGIPVEKRPKSDASVRKLSYAGVHDLEELLARKHMLWRSSDAQAKNSAGYVLTTPAGEPWHPDRLSREVEAFVRAQHLPSVTLHGLRHSFASIASDCGIPLLAVSHALGHSSPGVTGTVYTHLFDETVCGVVTAVAAAIAGSTQSSVSTS